MQTKKYTNKWINATCCLSFMLLNKLISFSYTVCFQLTGSYFILFSVLHFQLSHQLKIAFPRYVNDFL